MGLLSKQSAEVAGSIRFDGFDLLDVPDQTLRDLRGNRLAMIFQEPMTSLNPSFTIGDQIIETILRHRGGSRRAARRARHRAAAPRPYPLAGTARRRISAQALGRHAPARHDRDRAGLRSETVDRGRADDGARRNPAGANPRTDARAEGRQRCGDHPDHPRSRRGRRGLRRGRGDVCRRNRRARAGRRIVRSPQHPYTVGLLGSIPRLDRQTEHLATIEGMVPNMANPPRGCRFAARCPFAGQACVEAPPPLVAVSPAHLSRCIKAPLERLVS